MNEGLVDNLIGAFIIDLEDRIFGEKLIRQRIALNLEIENI